MVVDLSTAEDLAADCDDHRVSVGRRHGRQHRRAPRGAVAGSHWPARYNPAARSRRLLRRTACAMFNGALTTLMPELDRAVLLPVGAAGVLALVWASVLSVWVLRQPEGSERMKEISRAIQEGAQAYLNRQYTIIAGIGAAIFVFLTLTLGWKTGVLFLIGAVLSGAAGYAGMDISVRANLRTAEAARGGVNPALRLAFRGGAVTGLFVVGFGLIGVSVAYGLFVQNFETDFSVLAGFAFGASLISVFAGVGGGSVTEAGWV